VVRSGAARRRIVAVALVGTLGAASCGSDGSVGLDADACGWIVDLRGGGGNVWSLLMALAPLLGPGPAVGYRYRDGRTGELVIGDDGSLAGLGRPTVRSPEGAPVRFGASDDPVAVIQTRLTASAHEGAVMAFRGRPATRSFGTPTDGVPSAREGNDLADGSVLLLTTSVGVDRTGTVWEDRIPPDESVHATPLRPRPPGDADPAVDAALAWLAARPECG
jgi:carboxyl-terminal processing protease